MDFIKLVSLFLLVDYHKNSLYTFIVRNAIRLYWDFAFDFNFLRKDISAL